MINQSIKWSGDKWSCVEIDDTWIKISEDAIVAVAITIATSVRQPVSIKLSDALQHVNIASAMDLA